MVLGVKGVPSSTAWFRRLLDHVLTMIARHELSAVAC
jgi:hypothetical protein